MRLILHWILSALALMIVANLVRGFEVHSFKAALIAALVIGLVNATLGFLLKVLTFPFIILTLGLFWFVVNAVMLMVASTFVSGFVVQGLRAGVLGRDCAGADQHGVPGPAAEARADRWTRVV